MGEKCPRSLLLLRHFFGGEQKRGVHGGMKKVKRGSKEENGAFDRVFEGVRTVSGAAKGREKCQVMWLKRRIR